LGMARDRHRGALDAAVPVASTGPKVDEGRY
jgi:hypothetical protein